MDGTQEKQRKYFPGIDLFKFVFCVCIVAMHANAVRGLGEDAAYYIEKTVFRLAVPFFFLASGFLFHGGANHGSPGHLKKYVLRLLLPFAVFEIINIVLEIADAIMEHNTSLTPIEVLRHVAFYPYGALWFVSACIVGMLLLYPFIAKRKVKAALVLSIPLYCFALLCNNYYFLIENTGIQPIVDGYMRFFISPRNGVFVGFPFLALGYQLRETANGEKIREGKPLPYGACAAAIFVLYCLEVVWLKNKNSIDDSALFITTPLMSAVLLLWAANMRFAGKKSLDQLLRHARNLSMGVYFLHRPMLRLVRFFIHGNVPQFLLTLFLCIAVCEFVYKTKFPGLIKLLK